MLKKTYRLFLGLVAIAGSTCVTPTHVSSASLSDGSIIITHIQAGGVSAPKEELIAIYNQTSQDINITNWCLVNKYEVAFTCFTPDAIEGSPFAHRILSSYGHAVVVSTNYSETNVANRSPEFYSLIYNSANTSSGSIVGSADSISLINKDGDIVANKSWTSPIAAGKTLARIKIVAGNPDIYADTNSSADWRSEDADIYQMPFSMVWLMGYDEDDSSDDDEENSGLPENQDDPQAIIADPFITELLPNPAGSDLGNEFIELYNPNLSQPIFLDSYRLQVGLDNSKFYSFPAGAVISSGEYKAFYNSEIAFTLVNTTGWVQLIKGEDSIGSPIEYKSPKDGQSWALAGGVWQYSLLPTPGIPNETTPALTEPEKVSVKAASVPTPCAQNQYRNPETGRCKLISSSTTSTLTACKAGQERNPETNRCRNIVVDTKALSPCKEGQERNPETNRCRNIVKMTNVDHGVLGVDTSSDNQPRWYYWGAIAMVVILILSYAVWEWREELRRVWGRITAILKT